VASGFLRRRCCNGAHSSIVGALDRSLMHMGADQNLLTQTLDDRRAALAACPSDKPPTFTGD
jgi:hypothetical protein